jgi:lipopolysaccharide export system protein LptC
MTFDPQTQSYEEQAPATTVDPLSFIRPRAKQMVSARRALMVAILRGVLPAGALFVLGALIIWPMINPQKIAAIAMKNIPDLVIDNLHFTGLDSKNEPYSLVAGKATKPGNLKDIYDFDRPRGEITLTNGTWVSGKADYGRYNQDTRRLWLGGNVQLFQDKGYQFTTDEAQVDLNDNNAWGAGPVLIQGGFGTIRGRGFRLLDSGKVMVVTGPAHASLDLRSSNASDKPAKDQEQTKQP